MATMVEALEERIKALVEAGEDGLYVMHLRQQLADLKAQPDRDKEGEPAVKRHRWMSNPCE